MSMLWFVCFRNALLTQRICTMQKMQTPRCGSFPASAETTARISGSNAVTLSAFWSITTKHMLSKKTGASSANILSWKIMSTATQTSSPTMSSMPTWETWRRIRRAAFSCAWKKWRMGFAIRWRWYTPMTARTASSWRSSWVTCGLTWPMVLGSTGPSWTWPERFWPHLGPEMSEASSASPCTLVSQRWKRPMCTTQCLLRSRRRFASVSFSCLIRIWICWITPQKGER